MNKKILIIAIVLLLAVGIMMLIRGYSEDEIHENGAVPYISGKIYLISENKILVAEGVLEKEYYGDIEDLEGNAVWLSVNQETEIINDRKEEIEFELLETGDSVDVWITGVVLETYPAQAVAAKIILTLKKSDFTEKECFVGGCSGELCSDDPETISTCELLPGMECLDKEMRCELVEGNCEWILSQQAAECFLRVREEHGEEVTQTRIGYLFEKADKISK